MISIFYLDINTILHACIKVVFFLFFRDWLGGRDTEKVNNLYDATFTFLFIGKKF